MNEMELHRARTGRRNAAVMAQFWRGVSSTGAELRRLTSIFAKAAAEAWNEQRERQRDRRRYQPATAGTFRHHRETDLDEFGIPVSDPLLHPQQEDEYYLSLEEHQRPQDDFVFLNRFRRRTDPYASVPNLDTYFRSLYSYYYNRGLIPIVAKGVVELTTLLFTLVLSVFLLEYVDWKALSTCIDEESCRADFSSYVISKPLAVWSLWNVLVVLYCLVFSAYGVYAAAAFWQSLQEAYRSKWVFEERLGVSDRKLLGGAVDWDRDVVSKLVDLHRSGEYRITVAQDQELDALLIAHRIMRRENFLIALFNRGLIDLTVPCVSGQTFFCSSLEWSLYFCVLNFMFNRKFQIRPAFYLDPAALRRRFQLTGLAHAVFMPFLLFFLTLHFALQNAYDWKSTRQYLGPREWSLSAKWTFREFNELQHFFERRLGPSYEAAEAYLNLFGQNEVVAAFGRILVFVSGSLGAVLVAFAAVNDAILLHVKIADWNLLWYVGVVGALYSCGKAMIPKSVAQPRSSRDLYTEMDKALVKVAEHTHHFPDTWKDRGWDQQTHKTFSSMFQYKVKLFAMEVVSLIFAPFILSVSLANCAEPICEFVLAARAEVPGTGDVCGFATFDFEMYADETWEGRTLGNTVTFRDATSTAAGSLHASIMELGSVAEAMRRFQKPRARFGKMEKSFLTFKENFPSWQCSESGQNLVDRMEQYQNVERSARNREQELHREAAARQLDVLAQLEGGQNESVNAIGDMNDSYIPRQAPADAGAGAGRHT
jgi:autophagy-related protein 9